MSAIFIAYLLNFAQILFMALEIRGYITIMQIKYSSKIILYNEIKVYLIVPILLLLTIITKMANG